MRRHLPTNSKVVGGANQAGSEQLFPKVVYRHARRQGIIRRDQPFGKVEPICGACRMAAGKRRQDLQSVRQNGRISQRLEEFSATQHVSRSRLLESFREHASR